MGKLLTGGFVRWNCYGAHTPAENGKWVSWADVEKYRAEVEARLDGLDERVSAVQRAMLTPEETELAFRELAAAAEFATGERAEVLEAILRKLSQ
jgi:hypothetical protein